MSVSFAFAAVRWKAWRALPPATRSAALWETSGPLQLRELDADRRVTEWSYAVAASYCWDAMRVALDDETRATYDEAFGALFWDGPTGRASSSPASHGGAELVLDPVAVSSARAALAHEDVEGLEPFFDACCSADGRLPTFADFRRYLEGWAALLASVHEGEGLVAR